MAFIHKLVGPDEELIGIARLHWIYGLKGLLWLGGLIAVGGGASTLMATYLGFGFAPVGNAIFWMCALVGVILFAIYYIMLVCTEVGLTTQRFIYKRGFIMVDVREIDLEEIKSENVDNGVLGRILNYGYIELDARFIEDITLPAISDPYRFVKAMNEARTDIKKDSMRVVIDQDRGRAQSVALGLRDLQDKRNGKNQESLPDLTDAKYETMSNDAMENLNDMANNSPPAPKPPIFKNLIKKRKSKPEEDQSQKRELFVHEEALHDKIIDDFEEAEEPEEEKKKA